MKNVTLTKKTRKLTADSKALLEVAMASGQIVLVTADNVKQVLEYTLPAIVPNMGCSLDTYVSNVLDTVLHKYNENNERELIALCYNRVYNMPCVTFLFNTEDYEPVKLADLKKGAYVFCYVLNTENDWCSEFGSCYFKNYRRVS